MAEGRSRAGYQAYSIRFTDEEMDALRAAAEREKRPISDLIREALAARENPSRDASPMATVETAGALPVHVAVYQEAPANVKTEGRRSSPEDKLPPQKLIPQTA